MSSSISEGTSWHPRAPQLLEGASGNTAAYASPVDAPRPTTRSLLLAALRSMQNGVDGRDFGGFAALAAEGALLARAGGRDPVQRILLPSSYRTAMCVAPVIVVSSTRTSWRVGSQSMNACCVPVTRELRMVTFQAFLFVASEWKKWKPACDPLPLGSSIVKLSNVMSCAPPTA